MHAYQHDEFLAANFLSLSKNNRYRSNQMGNLTQGLVMAGALITVAIVFAFLYCLYIETFENNTDKPKKSDNGVKDELENSQEYEMHDLMDK